MEAVLDKFGRIVIPKKVRNDFNLKAGSIIHIEEGKKEIVLTPAKGEPSLVEKKGILVFTGTPTADIEKHSEIMRHERNRFMGGIS